MKPVNLLVSGMLAASFSLAAGQQSQNLCSNSSTDNACQAYIAGLVEGYVASKQNYLPKQPVLADDYLKRAYNSRVGDRYSTVSNKQPACLPSVLDKEKIVAHLVSSKNKQDLTNQLGHYLRDNYACRDSFKQ